MTDFLSRMTIEEARQRIAGFPSAYAANWRIWQRVYSGDFDGSAEVVSQFGAILRKWNATRPYPMRRPRSEAMHAPPYLDDLLGAARAHVQAIRDITIRDIDTLDITQISPLYALWDIFLTLAAEQQASCVGISKAVMLLTEGRIGPAFDGFVRTNLGVSRFTHSAEWVTCLRWVSDDIRSFESQHRIRLESLVPDHLAPIEVGRVYDMIAGPRL